MGFARRERGENLAMTSNNMAPRDPLEKATAEAYRNLGDPPPKRR